MSSYVRASNGLESTARTAASGTGAPRSTGRRFGSIGETIDARPLLLLAIIDTRAPPLPTAGTELDFDSIDTRDAPTPPPLPTGPDAGGSVPPEAPPLATMLRRIIIERRVCC